MSTPMDLDEPPSLNISRGNNALTSSLVSDVIAKFRPMRLFARDDAKEGSSTGATHVLSIDFDDRGELCMTSESDETIKLYNVKEGRHLKTLLSKKYGVKLAKFTHAESAIIYASTKQNDSIRYLATHDNSFIRYFEGHENSVTSLSVHPGADIFISCSLDSTVRLWDIRSKQWTAKLNLPQALLSVWDPSGQVLALASPASSYVWLYNHKQLEKPFSSFDLLESCGSLDTTFRPGGWTTLAFSNDGKHILVGTSGGFHYLLDSFTGALKALLKKSSTTRRQAPGDTGGSAVESSGECCFTPDGRYVLSGAKENLLVWDTMAAPPGGSKVLEPTHVLEEKREAAVVLYNPRFNMIATADKELMFWLPDSNS